MSAHNDTCSTFTTLMRRGCAPAVLQLVALALLIGWSVATVAHYAQLRLGVDASGRAGGGDFLAFYAAGRMIAAGDGPQLYSLKSQQAAQKELFAPAAYDGLATFLNPPSFALPFAVLSTLPFTASHAVYCCLMIAAMLAGLQLLKPHLPRLRERGGWLTICGLTLTFYPIVITATGGQNTPLSFLLLAWAYAALKRARPLTAGLALGLLAFKPQLAAFPLLLLLIQRRFNVLLAAGGVLALQYVLGAAIVGADWPLRHARLLDSYAPLEAAFNGLKSISIFGALEAHGGLSGWRVAALLAAAALALLIAASGAPRATASLEAIWSVAICAGLLLSPHTQWYEVGLLALPALLLLEAQLRHAGEIGPWPRLALLVGWLGPPLYALGPALGVQPLLAWPALLLLAALRVARRRDDETDANANAELPRIPPSAVPCAIASGSRAGF